MFNFLKKNKKNEVFIQFEGGKHTLYKGTQLIGSYSRRRDAVRGATRRGFTVAA